MELPILIELLQIFGVVVVVVFISSRLRIPTLVGFIVAGYIIGPSGTGLISGSEQVMHLTELGIILLLFTVGLEFSFKTLLRIKKVVFVGGVLQVVLTIVTCYFFSQFFAKTNVEALIWGFLVSLSSTAIVLKLLEERGEFLSVSGQIAVGILIFQDLIAIPMMLLIPHLGSMVESIHSEVFVLFAKMLLITTALVFFAKLVTPFLLSQVTKTRSKELFLLTVIVLCLLAAYSSSLLGLSLGLGAFVGGLIIAESDYNHQVLGNIMPFRDVFISLFFVSIGMMLDVRFVYNHFGLLLALSLFIIVIKFLLTTLSILSLKKPLRISSQVGLTLAQIGEFSLICAQIAFTNQKIGINAYQTFLGVSITTMIFSPLMIRYAGRFGYLMERIFGSRLPLDDVEDEIPRVQTLSNHVIIVGYGLTGRCVEEVIRETSIPYIILELNAQTVTTEKKKGVPIAFGDAANERVLSAIKAHQADSVIITIPDTNAAKRITALVKRLNPKACIIARTPFAADAKILYELGATEVIPDEYGVSLEILQRLLLRHLPSSDVANNLISKIKSRFEITFRT